MSFSLLDFIPIYPEQDDPEIQWKITAKKEFNELEATPDEKLVDFYNHQKIVHRYMREYDRLMIIHEAGTGKSCTFVGVAEFFFQHSTLYKKAYILEKNDTTRNEFKNQIMKVCAKYDKSSEMKKWYEVTTYQRFVSSHLKLQRAISANDGVAPEDLEDIISMAEIQEEFSDCIFLVDEAHNLRNSDTENNNPESEDGAQVSTSFQQRVGLLKKLFREALRIKVMISTATPMINEASEIVTMLNLLNEEDLPPSIDHNTPVEELYPYVSGKISYVRALDTGIKIEQVGVPRSDHSSQDYDISGMNIVPLYAQKGTPQYEIFEHFNSDGDRSPFMRSHRTASMFVFPTPNDPNYAITNHESIVRGRTGGHFEFVPERETTVRFDGMTFAKYVSDFNRLKGLSVKFAFIVKNELRYAYEKGRLDAAAVERLRRQGVRFDVFEDFELRGNIQDGNSFVYTANISMLGAVMLGLVMSQYGFSVFDLKENQAIDTFGGVQIDIGLRVAIISGSFTSSSRAALRVFGSDDNYDGKYIQCIIGSSLARDGINLPNSTRFYMASTEWHYSGMYQAMSRIIRATSHEILKQKNPGRRVLVNMYLLCMLIRTPGGEIASIDEKVYLDNIIKDRDILEMMRKLKIMAVDCILNYPRNYRASDVQDSRDCDYQDCEYQCISGNPGDGIAGQGPTKDAYDLSTFNILYADEIIERCKDTILESIRQGGSTTFGKMIDVLYDQIVNVEENTEYSLEDIQRYVFEAVERQVASRTPFLDSYGYNSYLQTDDINIFLQRDIPRKNIQNSGTIGSHNLQLVGWKRQNITEVALKTLASTTNTLQEVMDFIGSNEDLLALIASQTHSQAELINLMEAVMIEYFVKGRKTPSARYLINDYYRVYIADFIRPTSALEIIKDRRGTTKSIPAGILSGIKLDDSGPAVIIHVLASKNSVIFFNASITRKIMRVLDLSLSEPQWKDLDRFEEALYPDLYECYYKEFLDHVPQNKAYLIEHQGNDKIAVREDNIEDKRGAGRGGDCKTQSVDKIAKIFIEERIRVRDYDRFATDTNWDTYIPTQNRTKICEFLTEYLRSKSRVMVHPRIYPPLE
jgi:hypothetical protein